MKIFSREKKYYFNDWLEVKLLIDIAQSSKFISINKKQELIYKLITLTSETNTTELKRNLYVTGLVMSDNEKNYYIAEAVHNTINEIQRIFFYYISYNIRQK